MPAKIAVVSFGMTSVGIAAEAQSSLMSCETGVASRELIWNRRNALEDPMAFGEVDAMALQDCLMVCSRKGNLVSSSTISITR